MSSTVSTDGMPWITLMFLLMAGLFSEHVIGSPSNSVVSLSLLA
jgi:hypothetical protein